MKNSILKLGVSLDKEVQRQIHGGKKRCNSNTDCGTNQCCITPSSGASSFCGPLSYYQGFYCN